MRVVFPLVLLLAAACDRGSGPTTSPAATASSKPSAAASTPPAADKPLVATTTQPATARVKLLERLCKDSRCAGPFSSIQVYRDPNNEPQIYRLRGDLQRCSHPPTSYFDATGKEILVQANKPVVPGSAEAKRFEDERKKVLAGLKKAESHSCSKLPK